jgi:hypothetical protein
MDGSYCYNYSFLSVAKPTSELSSFRVQNLFCEANSHTAGQDTLRL